MHLQSSHYLFYVSVLWVLEVLLPHVGCWGFQLLLLGNWLGFRVLCQWTLFSFSHKSNDKFWLCNIQVFFVTLVIGKRIHTYKIMWFTTWWISQAVVPSVKALKSKWCYHKGHKIFLQNWDKVGIRTCTHTKKAMIFKLLHAQNTNKSRTRYCL